MWLQNLKCQLNISVEVRTHNNICPLKIIIIIIFLIIHI